MSTAAFSLVSIKLKEMLQHALQASGSSATVVLEDPSAVSAGRVSLWLYQVGLDEFSRNASIPVVDRARNRERS